MDTCSRLEEPGGVGWKDVNVGRLRATTSGKRLIWSHRVDGSRNRLGCDFKSLRLCRRQWQRARLGTSATELRNNPNRRQRQ
jgi:hypothetical protein